ncbi:MAG: hypothetical protein KAS32_01060 [Candidatus Peribacteraceae bacterium]|nr:hypothetical protein [Candidatus Peribacteraceae bacterium]
MDTKIEFYKFRPGKQSGWDLIEGELKVFKQFRHTLWVVHEKTSYNRHSRVSTTYWTVSEYFSGMAFIYTGAKDRNTAVRQLKMQVVEHGEQTLLKLMKQKFKQKNVPTKQILKRAYKLGYVPPRTELWSHTL